MIFIIQRFRTIVFIFIVIFTTFRSLYPPSSGVYRTRELSRNFEPRPLFDPGGHSF